MGSNGFFTSVKPHIVLLSEQIINVGRSVCYAIQLARVELCKD